MLLGVDTGGTFTDFVLLENQQIRIHKVLSSPEAPEQAILQGITELGLNKAVADNQVTIIHGSTVATNAALEGKGVKTAFITNHGLKDLLTIGRQTRRELYSLTPEFPAPPVPAELCLETAGRLSASGEILEPLGEKDLQEIKEQLLACSPQAVAINLLFSFLDDRQEKALEAIVPEGIFVSRSSFVLPEYKEYERGMATWLNAWLGPIVQGYLQKLQEKLAPATVVIMQSSGGTIAAEQAALRAVNMLLSGPAGGLAGALYIGKQINSDRLLTFDMGGTSTDISLLNGSITLTSEGHIASYPVAVPMVNMHTIGAGGGSIAYLDEGSVLRVGPESAGADPGPACYAKGGKNPTVTDAHVVLGRLQPDQFLGGKMTLDVTAARQSVNTLAEQLGLSIEETALGIITIANEHMIRALRVISVQRGYDPSHFRLCCFGGAGGLHLCELAEALHIRSALVPVNGGVLSAFGMLVAPRERQLSRTCQGLLAELNDIQMSTWFAELENDGKQQLAAEGIPVASITVQTSVDLRYSGQSFTLNINWIDCKQTIGAFHQEHEQRYGHRLNQAVELVNLRIALSATTHQISLPTVSMDRESPQRLNLYAIDKPASLLARDQLQIGKTYPGPLLISEQTATTLVGANWQVTRDPLGILHLERA
jgi:N-methylhydantoinase A